MTGDAHTRAVAAVGLPEHWNWRVEHRPRRTTVGINVKPGGEIVLAVPPGADPDQVARFVRNKTDWIARNLRHTHTHPLAVKQLIDGENFPLLDVPHRLRLTNDGPPAAAESTSSLSGGRIRELQVHRGDPRRMRQAIIDWYRAEGLDVAHQLGDRFLRRTHVAPGLRWNVRDIGATRMTRARLGSPERSHPGVRDPTTPRHLQSVQLR